MGVVAPSRAFSSGFGHLPGRVTRGATFAPWGQPFGPGCVVMQGLVGGLVGRSSNRSIDVVESGAECATIVSPCERGSCSAGITGPCSQL